MYKRGDNLSDYIGEIISNLFIFLIKLAFALLFLIVSISGIINNQTDIITTIISILVVIVLFYFSTKNIKKIRNNIIIIKTSGRFNIYLKNIGQLILFITAFSIVPVIFIIEKDNNVVNKLRQTYPTLVIIGFVLGITINIIDSILSSHTKNKNILIRYDKYNK